MLSGQTHAQEPFHIFLERHINDSPMKQLEMAEELGFQKPNIISMFKQGKTRVPLHKIPKFAKLLNLDPKSLLIRALSEYEPELLKALDQTFGDVVTRNELEIVHEIRRLSNGSDPKISGIEHKMAIEEFVGKIISVSH